MLLFRSCPAHRLVRVVPVLAATLTVIASAALAVSWQPVRADGVLSWRTDLNAKDRARVAKVVLGSSDFSRPEPFETMQGGAATSRKLVNRDAFSQFSANLTFKQERDFKLGNALFRKLWVSAPSSTKASDGLGPLYNSRACQNCHLKDGRGRPPGPDEIASSMFLRLSVPPRNEAEREAIATKAMMRIPEPTYGGQLQEFAVGDVPPEGHLRISHEPVEVALNGGETVTLRKPIYTIADLGYGPMAPDVMISPRVTPQMIGLGLLEAIHPGDIIAGADPDDADGDGISGKVSWTRNPDTGEPMIGRFGWKATMPTVHSQAADAFAGDIGIATPSHPDPWGDCTEAQAGCRAMPSGIQADLGDTEAPDPVMDLVAFYSRNLAVPMRRDVDDPQVLAGKELFYGAGCVSCHRPKFVTSRKAEQTQFRFQLIWPYTDMLLHDMGEGLADGRPVGDATGREWRTAPLWGTGLTETVNGHTLMLHDGRARNALEAILWHGGEAQASREAVVAMEPDERAALLRFLESL